MGRPRRTGAVGRARSTGRALVAGAARGEFVLAVAVGVARLSRPPRATARSHPCLTPRSRGAAARAEHWSRERPAANSFSLLQSVWLASAGRLEQPLDRIPA